MSNLTNFPNGIQTPFVVGGTVITQGNVYFVKPRTGADGNDGLSPATALKTCAAALAKCTAKQNDVVYLISEGGSTSSDTTDYQTATLEWNKESVHLIGVCADVVMNKRARISQDSTAVTVANLFLLSASNCVIKNIGFQQGVGTLAAAQICVKVTGNRNLFDGCSIQGVANAQAAASIYASCDLTVSGGAENVFRNCAIGNDTVDRSQYNRNIIFAATASKSFFEDCYIYARIGSTSYCSIGAVAATALGSFNVFKRCLFVTRSTNNAYAQAAVISYGATQTAGEIIIMDSPCITTGGSSGAVPVWTAGGSTTYTNMVAPTAAGAGGIMTKV